MKAGNPYNINIGGKHMFDLIMTSNYLLLPQMTLKLKTSALCLYGLCTSNESWQPIQHEYKRETHV